MLIQAQETDIKEMPTRGTTNFEQKNVCFW